MGSLYLRTRIPDGSKISISIEEGEDTPEGSFVGSVRLVNEDGTVDIWPDEAIHPGPKTKKLVSPRNYVWRVLVAFTSASEQTAVIRAEILKPDGEVFSTPYEHEVSGKNGDEARATIVAITLLDE